MATVQILNQSEAAMKLLREYSRDRWGVSLDQKAFFEITANSMVRAYVQFDIDGLLIGIEMLDKHFIGGLYGGAETFQSLHVVVTSDGRNHNYGLRTARLENVTFNMLNKAFDRAKKDGFKI